MTHGTTSPGAEIPFPPRPSLGRSRGDPGHGGDHGPAWRRARQGRDAGRDQFYWFSTIKVPIRSTPRSSARPRSGRYGRRGRPTC